MAITTASPDDIIASELWNEVAGLLNGTPGAGEPVFLTRHDSASVYAATIGNVDTTNGLALRVQYGPPESATVIAEFKKTGISFGVGVTELNLESILSSPGTTLSLQSSPGHTVMIDQAQGYTEAINTFALAVYKKFHGTGGNVGSANATFNQVAFDATTSGQDTTTVKITQHWTGSNATPTATGRGLEVEVIRYAGTAGTGAAAAYGATTPTQYGATWGIAIGMAHDPAIVAAPAYTFSMTGVDITNRGSGSVDGKTWASGGNKGTSGVNIWGESGFQYGIIYSGPTTPHQGLANTVGRIFHVAEAGGLFGILYQTASTTGSGLGLANTSTGGRSLCLLSAGSGVGAQHIGKLAVYDATAGVYLLSAGMNAADLTKGQVGVTAGTAPFPGLTFYDDLNTGMFSAAADAIGFATGGVEAVRITSGQLVDFRIASIGGGGGALATTQTIGAPGPATAVQNGWLRIMVNGVASFLPFWR